MVLQTRQKSMAGVAQKAKQGAFLGGTPPLGYDVANGKYIINPHESNAVALIFALYAEGKSYSYIIDTMAKKGYKGKFGRAIGKNSLHSILKNERYIGVYSWNKKQNKYMGKWAGGRPNPEAVRLNGMIPPIIEFETWERVQLRMKDNKRNATNTAKTEYLLSGLIECGECGGTFTGKTNTSGKGYKTKYYVCGNKYRNHTCTAKNINANEIEVAVVARLEEFLLTSNFEEIADEIMKAYNSSKSNISAERKELIEVEKKIANGTKALMGGLDYEELRDEIARMKVRRSELNDIISLDPNVKITKEMIIEKLKKDAKNITPDAIPRLVKAYITKVYAHNDEIIITGGVNLNGCGGWI